MLDPIFELSEKAVEAKHLLDSDALAKAAQAQAARKAVEQEQLGMFRRIAEAICRFNALTRCKRHTIKDYKVITKRRFTEFDDYLIIKVKHFVRPPARLSKLLFKFGINTQSDGTPRDIFNIKIDNSNTYYITDFVSKLSCALYKISNKDQLELQDQRWFNEHLAKEVAKL